MRLRNGVVFRNRRGEWLTKDDGSIDVAGSLFAFDLVGFLLALAVIGIVRGGWGIVAGLLILALMAVMFVIYYRDEERP